MTAAPLPGTGLVDGLLGDPDGSLAGHMAEDLARRIVLGHLRPGADLNSVDLARRYGSSRTPVREALLTLEREGLVEIPARRRPRVAPLTLTQIREVYQVRAALRGLVSELIVGKSPDLTVLADHLADLRTDAGRGDVDSYFWHNVAYHRAETKLAGNSALERQLGSLNLRVLRLHHRNLSAPGRLRRSLSDHERLLTAYTDRDAPLAVAITRSIVHGGYNAIEAAGVSAASAVSVRRLR